MNHLLDSRSPVRPVAVARIGVAFAILGDGVLTAGRLLRLADPLVIRTPYVSWTPEITLGLAWTLICVWMVSGLAFLLGWQTRAAGVVLGVTMGATLALDQQLYSNHLYLMLLLTGLLLLASAGGAISLDARGGRGAATAPGWATWLLQVQVSVVYLFAGLSKLNANYLSGSVIAASLRTAGPLAIPAGWRSQQPMMALAVLSICLELLVAAGLWSRRWRAAALVGGLSLHVGVSAWLVPTEQLVIFSLVMLPLYLLFLDAVPGSLTVVWDDGCAFCGGWVKWFRRLDWLQVLRFVPRSRLGEANVGVSEEEAVRALQLVSPGRVRGGFDAVAGVAAVVPLAFLWAPLLRVPPVRAAGRAVYRRVAARRTCPVPRQDTSTEPTG